MRSARPESAGRDRQGWLEAELGFAYARMEMRRLLGRASRRPLLTILLVVVAVSVVAFRNLKTPVYKSSVLFRITEGPVVDRTAPRPVRQLAGYLFQVVFTTDRLVAIARKHDLYRREMSGDPGEAAGEFRSDIGIQVTKNYFLEMRASDDPPRSATVEISYGSADPELSFAVLQDLRKIVEGDQASRRLASANLSASGARAAVAELQQEIDRRRYRFLSLREELAHRVPTPAELVELMSRQSAVEALEQQLEQRIQMQHEFALSADMEREGLSLELELVDNGRPEPLVNAGRNALTVALVALFPISFVVALCVGAFHPGLDRVEDIRQLGFASVFSVPVGRLGRRRSRRHSSATEAFE